MKKILLLAYGVIASALILLGVTAMATAAPKVLVCKYVGTPGTDERLQTGQNPISVSENSIKDFQGVGSYFNDAQGRSYVLAVDNGQEESVDDCPKPIVTPPVTPPTTPPVTPPTTPPATPQPTETQDLTPFAGK